MLVGGRSCPAGGPAADGSRRLRGWPCACSAAARDGISPLSRSSHPDIASIEGIPSAVSAAKGIYTYVIFEGLRGDF